MPRKIYLIIFTILSLLSCGGNNNDNNSISIVFTGDVLLDRGIKPIIEKHGATYLFKGVAPYFNSADFVVVNLECPITDTASPVNKKYIFRAPSHCADGLKQAGITHCALANNHTMDQGRAGLESTVRHLLNAGIVPLGFGYTHNERIQPTFIEKNGIRIAMFNSCPLRIENWEYLDNRPDVCQADYEQLAAEIHSLKAQSPDCYIVVILHWGTEFITTPSLNQRFNAAMLLSSGADAVIGHHPHVVQKMEYINGKPVFYSLGNFVFDQKTPDSRKAQMAVLTFSPDSLMASAVNVDIKGNMPEVSAHK